MDLFADVDFDKTANRVDKLLKSKLPRLARRCGRSLTDLSSPQLSSASSHSNRTDGQERMMVNSFSIGKVVDAICQTIYHCSDTSRIVLIGNYIKYIPQEQLIMMLPYEKTYYYSQLKPIALNEFADSYDYWQDQCDVELEDKIDLHVYVDN
ncbi:MULTISPECIES: ArpU family phage packaging/lysis transcriptional regulator [Lactobacillus]|uniref:ArpU family transcriptional regulator n=1 Tax=Lactobacillus xujianguonis TaxID=2495899 RepID=A0A437SXY6_9LACO|nr:MULTISPECIES: ArpU family phage packaging/lysis transcriptional regulator [Lactobacillus]RVU71792.1 ArpU family transcriptional regulator [Lactobacillus xujianguonis]